MPLWKVNKVYQEMAGRAKVATERLDRMLEADAEGLKYVRGKLPKAASAIHAVALTQALGDGSLKSIFADKFKDPKAFAEMKEFVTGSMAGLVTIPDVRTPDELLTLLGQLGPEFERRYEQEIRSLGIPDDVTQVLTDSVGAGWLKINLDLYMKEYGFRFDSRHQTFLPNETGQPVDEAAGTFYSRPYSRGE